ncbi:uncharacterized protein [Dendropsophus ebraccatus]|uniref:uncharacterized protein n=1 Tax=Dendropsophus ebraccatus TaxID=150705 RepID=UPI0038316BB3
MENWEYLEGHKDLNMENHKSLISPNRSSKKNSLKSRKPEENHTASQSSHNLHIDRAKVSSKSGSSKRNMPERCPSPYFQEDHSILQDNQGEHFSDFEIIVKEEAKDEKEVILVTIEEEELPKNTSPVARRRHRKQTNSLPICFIESQNAKVSRLRRMELRVKDLISAVQSHPELWDPSHRGYSDRQGKTAAWSSVCRYLYPEWDSFDSRDKGILDNDVRRRWRSARDQFRREIVQREFQNGAVPPSKKPYVYLEELMFLVPVLDLRPAVSNGAEADVQTAQEPQMGESELEIPASTPAGGASDPSDSGRSFSEEPPTPATSAYQCVLPLQFRGRKDKKGNSCSASVDTVDSQVLAYLQRNIEEDSEDAFVRSLGSYIRKVPESWRLLLRSSIHTLIEACIPPNDPENVLGLLDQVKLARPSLTAPPMDVEFTSPLAAYQQLNELHYGLSGSPQHTQTSYPQSPPSSHSFPRLTSNHSHSSTGYIPDSPSQSSYAFNSQQEPRSQASFPSNRSYNSLLSSAKIPSSSPSSSDHVHISPPPPCLTAYGSTSLATHSTSQPQSQ